MKAIYTAGILFCFAAILCGCPYESNVGLDEYSSESLNTGLLGTWRKPNYPIDSTEITFQKKNDYQYSIKAKLDDGLGGYEDHRFIGYFSKVNNGWILNVYDEISPKYYFVAVYLDGNTLGLKPLSEQITTQKFSTPAEMRKFIEQLYNDGKAKYDADSEVSGLVKAQ
jgi:hypothetical protein